MREIFNGNFDFKGDWGIPSVCGLRVSEKNGIYYAIATELYKNNPGSTITDVTCSLAQQVRNKFSIPSGKMVYIEHNPETKTKLSFYAEEYFRVDFSEEPNGNLSNPVYTKITEEELFV